LWRGWQGAIALPESPYRTRQQQQEMCGKTSALERAGGRGKRIAMIPPPEERQYKPEFLTKLANREYVEKLLRHREMTQLFAMANVGFPALVPMDIEAALVATHLRLPQPQGENPGELSRSADQA